MRWVSHFGGINAICTPVVLATETKGSSGVEIKSTRELHRPANRQVYNYLRSTNLEIGLLLHFGPEARFYRMIHRNKKRNPNNPSNPIHPDKPSVSVVRAEKPFPSSVIESSVSLRT